MRVEMRLDLTIYPKHYFWIIYAHVWQNIYTHYDEIMTKHVRWRSLDKTFTLMFDKTYTLITMKKFRQIIYEEIMTKHVRWSFDKTCTMKKSWQNIYAHYDEEVLTKNIRSLRWRHHDKEYTLITMKKSWKFMRWEKRWEKRWDLTFYPKLYFCWIQHKFHEFCMF